jgi:hypothetical protein
MPSQAEAPACLPGSRVGFQGTGHMCNQAGAPACLRGSRVGFQGTGHMRSQAVPLSLKLVLKSGLCFAAQPLPYYERNARLAGCR